MPDDLLAALPPGLFGWIGRLQGIHPDRAPARIVMHPGIYTRMITHTSRAPFGSADHGLFGMTIEVNDRIEPGTWQVYAVNGDLLRDSRMEGTL